MSAETGHLNNKGMCRCGHMPHDVPCTVRTRYGTCWCRRGLVSSSPATEVCSGCSGGGPLSREFCDECHLRMSTPSG